MIVLRYYDRGEIVTRDSSKFRKCLFEVKDINTTFAKENILYVFA